MSKLTDIRNLIGKGEKSIKCPFCGLISEVIKRDVSSPEDVFDLVEKKYNEKYGLQKKISIFKEIRVAAYILPVHMSVIRML